MATRHLVPPHFENPAFTSGPFIPPKAPRDQSSDLHAELERLTQELAEYRAAHRETTQRLQFIEAKLTEVTDERLFWEQMAAEADAARATLEQRLAVQQAQIAARPKNSVAALVAAS